MWLRFPWILQVAEDVAVEAAMDDVSRSSGSLCVLKVSVLVDCHVGCQRERKREKGRRGFVCMRTQNLTSLYTRQSNLMKGDSFIFPKFQLITKEMFLILFQNKMDKYG